MFGSLFDMDKPFWRWIGNIPTMFLLSMCWFICSIPLITIIPASCALYDAVSRNLMQEKAGCYRRFFRTFCNELKLGIPVSILWLVIGVMYYLGNGIVTYNAANSDAFATLAILYRILMVLTLGYLGWLVPLQSRYHNSFVGLHVNAFRFFLGRLPGTLLIILVFLVIVILPTLHHFLAILLFISPCLIAIFHTFPVEKAFRKVFPNDYEDGQLVSNQEERESIQAIRKAKEKEAKYSSEDR